MADNGLQLVKTWYSATLPKILAHKKNKVNPITNKPTLVKKQDSLSHYIIKKLTLPKRIASTTTTFPKVNSSLDRKKCLTKENIHIYLKSPYAVANAQLSGTVVIELDSQDSNEELQDIMTRLELYFIGTETVQDKTNEFINMKVKKRPNDHIKANKLCIPFSIPIPPDLNGTFVSKKGSIEYYLQSELLLSEPIIKKQNVFVYANMKLKSLRESAIFYSSLLEADRQVLRSTYGHVSVDLSMPRTLWISGTPIYLSFKLHNYTLFDTVSDIKLQLVCKQDVMDNDTICNIVSHTSLASLGWWRPLEPNSKDHVTMTIDVPPNLFTIQNQALIQVSFSVHVSIYSLQNSDVIADIPVTIAHPISMDPPPGNYTKTKTSQMPLFPQNNFQKQQQATKILEETSSVSSMDSIIHTRGVSSVTSISDNLKDQASSISSNSTKFHTIKKNLIHWGSRMTQKLSMSTLDQPSSKSTLRISSPLFGASSSSYHDIDSIDLSSSASISSQYPEKSMMKFGQMKGPQCFGQQPDCLGNAGLDIRKCFNVATASEALQSFAAEKVEIPVHLPQPVKLSENFRWKEGFIAPPEKCEIDISMLADEEQPLQARKYPIQTEQGNKKMLASSRHLRNVQRKSVQVSKDGRTLLTIVTRHETL